MRITVCILCYGDYPDVSIRCLTSLLGFADWFHIAEVRLGANQLGTQTAEAVRMFCEKAPTPVRVYRTQDNPGKYPLMRRMLYDSERPVPTQLVTWFDDDTYLNGDRRDVFQRLVQASHGCALLGVPYSIQLRDDQLQWIKQQPWYGRKPIKMPYRVKFVNGGFWTSGMSYLRKHNYPWPELRHNGGDVMLGELFNQQGLRFDRFEKGVCVNANSTGAHSSAPRRGMNTKPIGVGYTVGMVLSTAHQEFDVEVEQHGTNR